MLLAVLPLLVLAATPIEEAERLAAEAVRMATAQPQQALAQARKALALTAEFEPTAFVKAGRKGEVVEDAYLAAREEYRRHRSRLYRAFGEMLLQQGQAVAASRYLRRAVLLGPDLAPTLGLARALLVQGKGRAALDTLERAYGAGRAPLHKPGLPPRGGADQLDLRGGGLVQILLDRPRGAEARRARDRSGDRAAGGGGSRRGAQAGPEPLPFRVAAAPRQGSARAPQARAALGPDHRPGWLGGGGAEGPVRRVARRRPRRVRPERHPGDAAARGAEPAAGGAPAADAPTRAPARGPGSGGGGAGPGRVHRRGRGLPQGAEGGGAAPVRGPRGPKRRLAAAPRSASRPRAVPRGSGASRGGAADAAAHRRQPLPGRGGPHAGGGGHARQALRWGVDEEWLSPSRSARVERHGGVSWPL